MVKENKLLVAAKSKNLSNVIKVLEKFTKQKSLKNKNKKLDLEARDSYGLTAVHHAARNGTVDILETLLIHGGQFEVYDLHGLRPISYACAEGHKKVVEALLRWGSSANRLNTIEFLTPLHLASMYGYAEIVLILLQYKADILAINRDRRTALDLACAYGKYNVINVLLAHSAAANSHHQQQQQQALRIARLINTNQSAATIMNTNNSNIMYSQLYNSCQPHPGLAANYISQSSTPKIEHRYPSTSGIPNSASSISGGSCSSSGRRRNSSPFGGGGVASNSSRLDHSGGGGCGGNSCHNSVTGSCGSGGADYRTSSNNKPILSSQNSNCSSSGRFSDDKNIEEVINEHEDGNCCHDNTCGDVTVARRQQYDDCVPPNLEETDDGDDDHHNKKMNNINNERQNLREACFAVQARAISTFYNQTKSKSYAIAFIAGDLITVLKRFHNGLAKGFVTSEGLKNTGLFPEHTVEYLGSNRPPSCCDRPIQVYCMRKSGLMFCIQSPEKTPTVNTRKNNPDSTRPTHLEIKNPEQIDPSGDDSTSLIDEHQDSPIEIPPQMTDIRTATTTTCTSSHCQHHSQMRCCHKPSSSQQPPASNSSSPNPLPIPYLHNTSASSSNTSQHHHNPTTSSSSSSNHNINSSSSSSSTPNKRNSVASLDSGRGSAADNKSVVSSGRQAQSTVPIQSIATPSHFQATPHHQPSTSSTVIPPSPNTNQALPGHVSVDSLYHQCSLISLDDEANQHQVGSMDEVLITWLHYIGLGHHAETLYQAGYDIATLAKATPEDLNASGVTNPHDRQFLKSQLSRLSVYDGLPETVPKSLSELLSGLKLSQYEQLLINQNFTQVENLVGLSWEDLADLGIEKLGHQKKLSLALERISRLQSTTNHDTNNNSSSKSSLVSQSKSFEELPYPSAIMNQTTPTHNMFYNNNIQSAQQPQYYGSTPRKSAFPSQQQTSPLPAHTYTPSVLSSSHSDESVSSSVASSFLKQHTLASQHQHHHHIITSQHQPTTTMTPLHQPHHNNNHQQFNPYQYQDDTHIAHLDNQLPRLLPPPMMESSNHFAVDTNTGTVRVRRPQPTTQTTAATQQNDENSQLLNSLPNPTSVFSIHKDN